MVLGSSSTAAVLRDYLKQHPSVKLYTPDNPDFGDVKGCWLLKPAVQPFAIAQPQSAADVQALVRFCVDRGVDFVVRSGGHDTSARSQVHGALTIDLRALNSVVVDTAAATARVGGGALLRDVARELEKYELVTPVGSIASVGYAGWATLGGYGPFAASRGPGADQILGAKLVDPKGELIDAGEELLKGIRGGGGIFGVIVELTIKTFPLKEIVPGIVVTDPTDIPGAWHAFAAAYEGWLREGLLPAELYIQPLCMPFPGVGKVFALGVTWTGPEQGPAQQWVDKVADAIAAATGKPPVMTQAAPSSVLAYIEQNEKILIYGVYGRVYSLNFRAYTPATAAVLGKYANALPDGGLGGLSIHSLRSPQPSDASVFGARTDHCMLEVIALAQDEETAEKSVVWANACIQELREADPGNILESAYVSLRGDADSDYKKIYGEHYETLVALKKKYDPDNVFKYAVPKLASAI